MKLKLVKIKTRSHKKSQRLPRRNELDSKIEQNKQLVDKVQRILDEIKVATPKPTTRTDEITCKKVTETPSTVIYRETSIPSLEESDQELDEEAEKRLEEAEKSHNRPITRRLVNKTDEIKKDRYKTERSGSETEDSIDFKRLQDKLNSIDDPGSSSTTIEGYLSLRSEHDSRKEISKGDQSSSSSADSSDESKKDYPPRAPKRRLRVKNKASLHDSGKSNSSLTLKSLHVVPSQPTPICTKKHNGLTILKTAGNSKKTVAQVVKTFKHCKCNTSLVTGKDFTCNTKKEEVYLDSGCNTESKEFKDLSAGTGLYEKCKYIESATNTLPPNQTKDIALNINICNENKDNTCNTDVATQEDFGCVAKICYNNDFTCSTPILELQDSTCNTPCLVKKDEICCTEIRTTSEVSCFTDIKKEVITEGTQRDKLEGLNMTVRCIKTTDISPKSNLEKTKTLTSQLLPSINIKSTPTFQKILQYYIDQNGVTHIEYQYVDEKIGFCEARCNKDNQSIEDKQKIKSSKQENVQQHIEISKQSSTNIEGPKQVIKSDISNYNTVVEPILKNVTEESSTQENIKCFQEQESKFKGSLQNQDTNINVESPKQVFESYISNYNTIAEPIQKNVTDETHTQENIKRFQEQESKFKKNLQNQDTNTNVESPKQIIESYISNYNTIAEPVQKNVTDESPTQENIKHFQEQESKSKKSLQNQDTNTTVETLKQPIKSCHIPNFNTIVAPIEKNFTDKSPTQENIKRFQEQECKLKKSLQNQDTNTNVKSPKRLMESYISNYNTIVEPIQKNVTDESPTQENIKRFQEQESKLKKSLQNQDTNISETTKNKKIGTESSQQHDTTTEKLHREILSMCNKEIQVPSLVKSIPSTETQSKPTSIDKSVSAVCPGQALCCSCYKAENLQTKSNPSKMQSISEERLHQFDKFTEFEFAPKLFDDKLDTRTIDTDENSLDDIISYESRNNEEGMSHSESSEISYNSLKRGMRKAFKDTDLIETDSYRKFILQSYSIYDSDQNKHNPGELSSSCLQMVEQKIDDAVYKTFINPEGKSIAPSNCSTVDITRRTPNSDKSRSDRSKRRASRYSDSDRYKRYLIDKKHGHMDLAPKLFNLGLYENKETQYDHKTMYSSETPMSDVTRILKPTLDEKTISYRNDKPLSTGGAVTPTTQKKPISDRKESSESKPTRYRQRSKISYEDISLSISYSTDESDEETSKPKATLSSSLPKNKLHKISTTSGTTFRQLKEKISLNYPELSIDSTDPFAKLADGGSKEFDLTNTDGSTYVTGILQQNENELKKFIPIIKRSVHSSSKSKQDLKEINIDRNGKSYKNSEEKNKMKINMTVLPIHIQGDSVLVDKQRIVDDLYVGKNGRYRDEKNLFSQENFMQLNKKVLELSTSTGTTEMSFSDGEIRCHCSVSNGEIHMCPNRESFRKFRKPHSFQKDIGLTAVRKRRHYLNNMITYYFNKHGNVHDSSSTS